MDKTPNERAHDVTLTVTNAGEIVTLSLGETLQIRLDSNPTTGYQWRRHVADAAVLRQVGEVMFVKPDDPMLGAGGTEVFTFQAIAPGRTMVKLVYLRPWEKDLTPAATFSVTVVVQIEPTVP